ncbi:hypothetical protein [Phyllobacterium phragmitis]|uniref:hypothetical protein n=1 Tax=Phyllobacterium phragmitis TaxID=2670329 RepID=UPI0011B22886|nr:hypothetical protein [Phyllobacterium phragmitis]
MRLAIAGTLLAQPAFADCQCLGNGLRYNEGEQVCLKLSTGPQLARCEKVLNNSSWKMLGSNCQLITRSEQSPTPPPQRAVKAVTGEPQSSTGRTFAASRGF